MPPSPELTSSSTTRIDEDTCAFKHLPFTVGVEIESILLLPLPSTQECNSKNLFPSPLDYLQDAFSKANLSSMTADHPKAVDHGYKKWLITTDGSIDLSLPPELVKEKLGKKLKGRGCKEGAADAIDVEVGGWDTHGIELVSPPLPAPDIFSSITAIQHSGMEDIKRYLDVLVSVAPEGHLEHTAFTSHSCGLHVHIGLPNSQAIPLPVLQQLAYLVLKYEDILNSLHHHSRTPFPGTQASAFASSNRTSFLSSTHAADCNRRGAEFDLEKARRRIFAEGMTVEKLVWMMGAGDPLDEEGNVIGADATASCSSERTAEPSQWDCSSWEKPKTPAVLQEVREWQTCEEGTTEQAAEPSLRRFSDPYMDGWFNPEEQRFPDGNKYKLTRWNLLARHPCQGPRTIEFRQAAGSVDAEEIAETVRFYVALLRCAERAANANSEDSMNCSDCEVDEPRATMDNLFDLVVLPPSVRQYWTSRAQRLTDECFFSLREPSALKHWQKCQACATIHSSRIHARVRRGQQSKGWQAFLKGNTKGKTLWNKFSRHGIFNKDKWIATSAKAESFDDKAVAKPVKFSKRRGKGKNPVFTRKEKAAAKTRARVQARKQAQKAYSDPGWNECADGSGVGWTSSCKARSGAQWDDSVDACVPSEPCSGW